MARLELQYIPVNRIRPNPHQPREDFPKEALEELASSIKEHGLVQPIVVRREKDGYMIVAGERRWRAYQLAKIDKVPAVVKDVDEKEVLLESLLENINRENLKWSEQENAIWDLWESGAFRDYEELGRKLGKKVKDQAGDPGHFLDVACAMDDSQLHVIASSADGGGNPGGQQQDL